jgi:hypothetical protein
MSKTNYAAIVDGSKFNAALRTVFTGISTRRDQIHELNLAAIAKATQSNDFDWLSRIAVQIEDTKCLNLKMFADWVKAHIVITSGDNAGKPALEWQREKRSFKLAEKGAAWHCKPILVKWYEMGKPPKMDEVYSLTSSLDKVLHTAASKAKKGELPPAEAELMNKLAGLLAEYKTKQITMASADAAATLQGMTPEQAAAAGAC